MNRLVIIGNGFDLAHGLPTGYCDFINWYWRDVTSSIELFKNDSWKADSYEDVMIRIDLKFKIRYFDELQDIKIEFAEVKSYESLNTFLYKYKSKSDSKRYLNVEINGSNEHDCSLLIKNSFFKLINNLNSIQNWVDIENEYYKLLKDCLTEGDSNNQVKKLNEEFEQVKNLLEKYLLEDVANKFDFTQVNNISEILKNFLVRPKNLDGDVDNSYLKEFPSKYHLKLVDFDNQLINANKLHKLKNFIATGFEKNLFLNFNYTPTIDKYVNTIRNSGWQSVFGESYQIQIHGRLIDNDINFGFGDEMDDHYKLIENKDDNEYLKYIKSFQYFQNSNYKDMLDFIETEEFQVYIMGHSCGLSDRILLNKIFENHNCLSIKVFYHKFTKPKADGRTDNYTDIVQNISRHFNKKELMREKIVNKSLCEPLSQNVRFESK